MGFLYIVAAFLAFIVITTVISELGLSRHRGVSREAFIAEFTKLDVPETISAAVYDYYKSRVIWKAFTVSPNDTLAKLFSDYPEDLEDDAHELVRRAGMQMPNERVLCEWGKPFKTLGDMVLWLEWVRQHQQEITS
jgi:hypothetical protein